MTRKESSSELIYTQSQGHIKRSGIMVRHADFERVVWSKPLRSIVMDEFGHYLNEDLLRRVRRQVSIRTAAKNIISLANILSEGKLHDSSEDYDQILWLVSFAMDSGTTLSESTVQALMKITIIVSLHEVILSPMRYNSREFKRTFHFICAVFSDTTVRNAQLKRVRDKGISIIRKAAKAISDSEKGAALLLLHEYEKRAPIRDIARLLKRKARELEMEYSKFAVGGIPSDIAVGRKEHPKSTKSRRRDSSVPIAISDAEESSVPSEGANTVEDGANAESPYDAQAAYHDPILREDEEVEVPHDSNDDLNGQVMEAVEEPPVAKKVRKPKKPTHAERGSRVHLDEESVGHARHERRRAKRALEDDVNSNEYRSMDSEDFPAVVADSESEEDHAPPQSRKPSVRESVRYGITEESVTLSDQLDHANLEGDENCVQELHKASTTLKRSGPIDPLQISLKDAKHAKRRRVAPQPGPAPPPREATPIPDSDGAQMKYKTPQTKRLNSTPTKRRREEIKNEFGQVIRRGRFQPHEDEWLVEGIKKYGWGAWTDIVKEYYADSDYTRMPMSLKDRARTLSLDPDKYPMKKGGSGRKRAVREDVGKDEHDPIQDSHPTPDSIKAKPTGSHINEAARD